MLCVAKWYLAVFCNAGVFTYRCWYDRLYDRGYGYIHNVLKRENEFLLAQLSFGVVGIVGIVIFEVFRRQMPRRLRIGYFVMVAAVIVFFIVDRIVVVFGPEPDWHS